MYLTAEEEKILSGEQGPGPQRAMELLVALGRIYDADRLVPITSAHLSGVSYKTIGEGGIDFLKDMSRDAKVQVPTTLNPMGMDAERWKEMRVPERFSDRQLEIMRCYSSLGVRTTCSCTPYLGDNVPRKGDTIAWAESSALSYSNSVLGARTNREGGPGALAAAILGRTPHYGMHLEENRAPTVVIEVEDVKGVFEHSLLGHAVGLSTGASVPYFKGIRPDEEELKIMAAAMAASGSVAMFHVDGSTPESGGRDLKGLEVVRLSKKDLEEVRAKLSTDDRPDLIALGCPHLSVKEIRELVKLIKGKPRPKETEVWFCSSRSTVAQCPDEVASLNRFGKVVCDTCMIVAPIEGTHKVTGTNSCKACSYLPGLCSQKVVCQSAPRLLEVIT
jgi:predicted aconitase